MCMEIFDLAEWEPLIALAPSQSLLRLQFVVTADGHYKPTLESRQYRDLLIWVL